MWSSPGSGSGDRAPARPRHPRPRGGLVVGGRGRVPFSPLAAVGCCAGRRCPARAPQGAAGRQSPTSSWPSRTSLSSNRRWPKNERGNAERLGHRGTAGAEGLIGQGWTPLLATPLTEPSHGHWASLREAGRRSRLSHGIRKGPSFCTYGQKTLPRNSSAGQCRGHLVWEHPAVRSSRSGGPENI